MRWKRVERWAVGGILIALMLGSGPCGSDVPSWLSWGQNLDNTRHQALEEAISPETVADLQLRWVARLGGSISATPAVQGDAVYVPDWGGNLFRLDAASGAVVWSTRIEDYTGIVGDLSRATPAIDGPRLILGDQGGRQGQGARVMAIDKQDGALLWVTQVEDHPASFITQSAVVHHGVVYVGVSSGEEAFAALIPGYVCCTFRGSVVALDAQTGAILWQTFTIPDPVGYAGNAVWGSAPVVDTERGSLYVTTGNPYSLPQSVLDCVSAGLTNDPDDEEAIYRCMAAVPGNFFDAFVALDLDTGAVRWSRPVLPFDAFTIACVFEIFNPQNCPSPEGPDHDFGQAPMLYTVVHEGVPRQFLGAGQKSGTFWALDPEDGLSRWNTKVGPGGAIGGMMWGSATDGERIYTAIANSNALAWELQGIGPFAGQVVTGGFWSALDARTGEILWQTPEPSGAQTQAPLSVANGVVFAASLAPGASQSTFFALDANTGEILWEFASGASVNGGAAIVDGAVYWGSGYTQLNLGTPNNELYAFELR